MTRPIWNLALVTAITLGLWATAPAEQLWVRNRPFKGIVQGSGPDMLVELGAFVEAMRLNIEDRGDSILLGGFPIPVETVGSKRLVPLRDVVDAAGLNLTRNTQLGTVDVRGADAGTGSSGSWEDFSASSEDKERYQKTVLEGPLFKVTIPGHLLVLTDPQYLKEGDKERVATSDFSPPNAAGGLQNAFAVTTKDGFGKSGFTASFVTNLPNDVEVDDEKPMLEFAFRRMASARAKQTQQAQAMNIAGQRYVRLVYEDSLDDGEPTENELYLQLDPKKRVAYVFTLSATKKLFKRVAPQFRIVLKSFRAKK